MRTTFLYLTIFSCATLLYGCDSSTSNTASSESDSASVEAELRQTTEQITENNEVAEPVDMIYYVFMNHQMQTRMGELAEQKSSSEEVRMFSTDVIEENKQMMAKVEELASSANLSLPQGLQVEDQERLDSLTQLSGEEFEQAYVKLILEQKQKNIELMQELATSADNPIVQGLASDIVEIEQDQIERAEIMQEEMM